MGQNYQDFHRRSIEQPEAFWGELAHLIHWETPPEKVLDFSRPPFAKWFVGGRTNLCYNAVDRHLEARGDQNALIYISTETQQEKAYTFRELHREVNRFAAVLQELGVGRGDRVIIYMPMIAESIFAVLACVRLGAIHSVVFGGFAAASLASRIDDARPKLMITSDGGMRGGKFIPYKHLVDEAIALAQCPPQNVLICHRGIDTGMARVAGRDVDYAERRAQHMDAEVPVVWLESSEPPTSCIPPAPPASPRACSATPAAMRSPWRPRCHTSMVARRARPIFRLRTSAGWSAIRTSSMVR